MLETDYLVIGSGAMGMAFVDTLLSETDAHVIMVDRYAKPGGHWNVAYPFVTLHQPSQFYGVSSKELSKGQKDEIGLNKGYYDLASGAEVGAYFDDVMRNTFLPTGRVQYFPLSDYKGDYKFESMLTGEQFEVKVRKKLVDCTQLYTSVPATHTPGFEIEEGVNFMPLNDLPKVKTPPEGFVVVGAGKTGMDACVWLLTNGINPEKITWIVSRDSWVLDRANTQPGMEFFEATLGTQAKQMQAIAESTSIENLFDRLEEAGVFHRLDPNVRPKIFHGATVSKLEMEQLQRIPNIVRMGRVQKITPDQIILDEGTIPTSPNHIHVDCSASAITNLETKPIFQGKLITPQTVRAYQPVFSASVVAYVEANYEDDKTKNKLCQVVPLPNEDVDWIPMTAAQMVNQITWSQDKTLRRWVRQNRLDGFGKLVAEVDRTDVVKMAILKKFRDFGIPAMMKLQQYIAEINATKQTDMQNPQMQVKRSAFFQQRISEMPASDLEIGDGEILVKVEKFAYTANNITYAVAGDMIGYWKFFPAMGKETEGWGVIPVWGFGEIVESNAEGLPVGERLFGYWPPATAVKMKPVAITDARFIDGAEHRQELPGGYNLYRRLSGEKGYNPAFDKARMLLWPLYLTGFCIWDQFQEKNWFDAKQIIVMSASSKTSIGLAYALRADENAPKVIGMTSPRNLEMVKGLGLYDEAITYDDVKELDAGTATVIVDMSGNNKVLAKLHTYLGDNMKFTSNVGITHWDNALPQKGVNQERSKFFFAPGHIQKRMKEWGPAVFDQKTQAFIMDAAGKTQSWLKFKTLNGLNDLAAVHPKVCEGTLPPEEGLIVEM